MQWNTFSFLYGTLELSCPPIPLPVPKLWPAHWMLGTNCQSANKYTGDTGTPGNPCPSFNASGYDEIDISRVLWRFPVTRNLYHNGTSPEVASIPPPNWDTAFHTITLDSYRLPQSPSLADGTQFCNWTTNLPTVPMFLIMQTQTGGVAGTPVNSQLPVTLTTKYVKVCNQNLTAAQCTAAAPTAAGDDLLR